MLSSRIDWLSNIQIKNRKEVAPDGLEAEFKRFYYDTANAGYAGPMAALLKLVPVSQIVFGTDYPYVSTEANMKALRTAGLSDADIRAIETQNAKQFLPRLRG
jgi:predicted TIM-barrel fold metal-dependent hydrolase